MKAFVMFRFNYYPLNWMFHGRKLNNNMNKTYGIDLRPSYKDNPSSFGELLGIEFYDNQ